MERMVPRGGARSGSTANELQGLTHSAANIDGKGEISLVANATARALPAIFAVVFKNKREAVRIALEEYRGNAYIDLRIFFNSGDGDLRPSGKGIAVAPRLIPAMIAALQAAQAECIARGLIDGGGTSGGTMGRAG